MNLHLVEVTNGFNWGKFGVGRFTAEEWEARSAVDASRGLLDACGWAPDHVWVLDLQTGEGVLLRLGGSARADLMKHKVWVCPMFEPFLVWLYRHGVSDLPAIVTLTEDEAPSSMFGYRRDGQGV